MKFLPSKVFSFVMAMAVMIAAPALANHHEHHHGDHTEQSKSAPQAALSPASKEYEAAMQKMHTEMAIPYLNSVELDFVRGMIPHHQGAIDQAQILLKYSKNGMLRRLAGGIIATQKREIRFMKYWLEQHAKGVESGDMPIWLKETPEPQAGDVNGGTEPGTGKN